jgi:hypothetical protein
LLSRFALDCFTATCNGEEGRGVFCGRQLGIVIARSVSDEAIQ